MRINNVDRAVLRLVFVSLLISGCRSQGQVTGAHEEVGTTSTVKALEIPTNTFAASSLVQQEGEELETFLARIAVMKLAYSPSESSAIIQSVVVDENNLWFGVSTHPEHAQACWMSQDDATLPCADEVLVRVFRPQSAAPAMLKIFFAVAYRRGEEMLVVYDRHDSRNTDDNVDGFRVLVVLDDSRWREQSLQAVY